MIERYRRLTGILLLVLTLFLAGCSMEVQHGLTERQANKIIVLFSQNGIQADKMKSVEGREIKWTIIVNKADAVRAIRILQENNLPPKKEKDFSQVYGQTGMIPTASQERARYLMALSGELNKTLKKIGGILSARVHIVIPKDRILTRPNEKQPEATASVLLKVNASNFRSNKRKKRWLDTLHKDAKRLVAGSVEALKKKNVNVIIRDSSDPADSSSTDSSAMKRRKSTPMGRVTPPPGPEVTAVLSINVAKEHAMRLKLVLGSMILLLVVFISLFVWFFTRTASLKNQLKAFNGNM